MSSFPLPSLSHCWLQAATHIHATFIHLPVSWVKLHNHYKDHLQATSDCSPQPLSINLWLQGLASNILKLWSIRGRPSEAKPAALCAQSSPGILLLVSKECLLLENYAALEGSFEELQ